MPDEVTPFRIDVPEEELRDLRERLRRTLAGPSREELLARHLDTLQAGPSG